MSVTLIAAVLGFANLISADHEPELKAIRDAYEANREAHSAAGTIRFHGTCRITEPSSLEAFNAAMKNRDERPSPSKGVYYFDGNRRRRDNLQSLQELVASQAKASPTFGMFHLWTGRALSDGEYALVDTIHAGYDSKAFQRSTTLHAKQNEFFRSTLGMTLNLGNPTPYYDLGRCLTDVLEKRESAVLAEFDDTARIDGGTAVKITVKYPENPHHPRTTFWVDRERGAIPLQTRYTEFDPRAAGTVLIQINNNAIRRTEKGWLPFHMSHGECDLMTPGEVSMAMIRVEVIDEADFFRPPDNSVFAIEFPEEVAFGFMNDAQSLSLGKRRVWTLDDFSHEARERAKAKSPLPPPPGPSPWAWRPPAWLMLVVMILACVLIVYRKPLGEAEGSS